MKWKRDGQALWLGTRARVRGEAEGVESERGGRCGNARLRHFCFGTERERELESVEIEIEDDEIGAALSAKMKAHGGSLSLQGRVLEQATPFCHIFHRKCPNHILLRIGP